MKEWLCARELAEEALPDLPKSERGMQLYAECEGWNGSTACRTRKGRGGGLEYHIRLLPTLARLEYERKHRKIEAPPPPEAPALVLGHGLTARAARERDARLAVVRAFTAFANGGRLSRASLIQIFTDRYNTGSQAVEGWVREMIPALSRRTLRRWLAATTQGRMDRLAVDRAHARKGKGLLETANGGAVEAFIRLIVPPPAVDGRAKGHESWRRHKWRRFVAADAPRFCSRPRASSAGSRSSAAAAAPSTM